MFRTLQWIPGSKTACTRNGRWKRVWLAPCMGAALIASIPAQADAYLTGYITRVSYAQDVMLIMLSSGVPSNCTGVSYGWLTIPAQNKAIQAFGRGWWMRGDAAGKPLAVYTSGLGVSSEMSSVSMCAGAVVPPPGPGVRIIAPHVSPSDIRRTRSEASTRVA